MPESSDADRAYARAQELIAHALETGATELDLRGAPFGEEALNPLDRLPPELADATALQSLDLGGTRVSDLTPLQRLTALQSLSLWDTQVSDLTPLQRLSALQSLNLTATQVRDLTPLQRLTALQSLYLTRTQVSDLTPLQRLPALQNLDLTRTQVTDLRPIRDLPQMDGVGQTSDGFGLDYENGLFFAGTEATRRDPELARLSAIDDHAERTQATLAYLRGLTDLAPASEPDSLKTSKNSPEELLVAIEQALKTLEMWETRTKDMDGTIARLGKIEEQLTALDKKMADQTTSVAEAAKSTKEIAETTLAPISKNLTELQQEAENLKTRMGNAINDGIRQYVEDKSADTLGELWRTQASKHETEQKLANRQFVRGILGFTLLVLALLSFLLFGNADALLADSNDSILGFKNAVFFGSVFTVFTTALWWIRLQMKVYLSERHLCLDARERASFAEAYRVLLGSKDENTDGVQDLKEQRAIIYTALFSRSTNGIIKDESSGMDPSLMAAVSKVLSKP